MNRLVSATVLAMVCIVFGAMPNSVQASDYFNGFEVDTSSWFSVTRVATGTNGIPSASGSSWHAEAAPGAFTRWGGYGDTDGCSGTCPAAFPPNGYDTSVDIYLDVGGGFLNDSRFDFSSAIQIPAGSHRRDFIFGCGFYDDNDGPGAGTNRFICTASNNAPGWPKNPAREPTVIASTTGWYTFLHEFRDDGSGVLTVDLSVLDSGGTVIKTWTLSDSTDVIGTTVGGNRYGWLVNSALGALAFDNAQRTTVAFSCSGGGFQSPFDVSLTLKKKSKRAIPVKMILEDDTGAVIIDTDLSAPPVVNVEFNFSPGDGSENDSELVPGGLADDGNAFRFDPDTEQWVINLATKQFASPGTYTVTAVAGDGTYVINSSCTGTFERLE